MQSRNCSSNLTGIMRLAFAGAGLLALSGQALAAPVANRASDAAPVAAEGIAAALARDALVISLEKGDELALHSLQLQADSATKIFVTQSSQLLTVAVVTGMVKVKGGATANAGDALVLALDGGAVEKAAFDASRLAASNSPGAASLIRADLDRIVAQQKGLSWWGFFEPTGVNAVSSGAPAVEDLRRSYLGPAVIVAQRRAAPGERSGLAVNAFLAALGNSNKADLAALLDPAPFLARVGPEGLDAARTQAAAGIASDIVLRSSLGDAPTATLAEDGASARITGGAAAWKLSLVTRDSAVFVSSLEQE